MKIHHALGPLAVILLANTASAQEEAAGNPLARAWGERMEKWAGLTLDDKLLLSRRDSTPGEAGTAVAQARVPSEDYTSRPYLADRGDGIHTSIFGTYVRKQELLVYLFYEYARNRDAQSKSRSDPTGMPQTFRETGVGDTEGQIRYRWFEETEVRPELITFFEAVFPLQKSKKLIGNRDWELALGVNVTKGFSWGTLMLKVAGAYSEADKKVDWGDWGIEYVKRLNDRWRVVLALDGTQDEVEAVVELQWKLRPNITLKLNSGFGVTPKAPEFAPEFGVLFSF